MSDTVPAPRCQIIIATLLRRNGASGIQTHMRVAEQQLTRIGAKVDFVNPFSAWPLVGVPLFGLRRLFDPVHHEASIWWYRRWHYEMLLRALRRRLPGRPPVVVYAQCPLSAQAALMAREGDGQRVVLAIHFSLSQADEWAAKGRIRHGGRVYRGIAALEADVLPRVDGVVYLSEYMREQLEARHPGLRQVPSVVIPNFIGRERSREGVGEPLADLITVGELDRNKNHEYILEALAIAHAGGRRYSLSVVGDGFERRHLERRAHALGIAGSVSFLGSRRDVADLLPRHRVYVHAARMDNVPLALIEALRAGLPVVAPAVGGIPEIVRDGVDGILVPLDEPPQLARAMAAVLEDEPARIRMSAAGQARFGEHFDAAVVAPRLASFLCGQGHVGAGGGQAEEAIEAG